MDRLADLIRTERVALIDDLVTLTPDEWFARSLCGGWTVQDVAAHLAWAPVLPVTEFARTFLRSGMHVNRTNAQLATRWSRRGPDMILRQLRDNAARDAKPHGVPRMAALVDAVVHALDIRRPLARKRLLPAETFIATADYSVGLRGPLTVLVGGSARKRVAGLRLIASDGSWTHGEGPEVHASPDALLLVLYGRPVGPGELTGPGAATLYARL
ncbi:MAG: maleylpyruvate isomerase family mycothiol-dependent enzyme [Oryzihumus sp.]